VLAGGVDGTPRVICGITFPVLRAAQMRQRKPVTPNAIWNSPDEVMPAPRRTKRWPKKRERTKSG
jgi:hypothetical protein